MGEESDIVLLNYSRFFVISVFRTTFFFLLLEKRIFTICVETQ